MDKIQITFRNYSGQLVRSKDPEHLQNYLKNKGSSISSDLWQQYAAAYPDRVQPVDEDGVPLEP